MLKKINIRHFLTDLTLSVITFYLSLFLRVNPDEAKQFLPDLYRILPIVIFARTAFFVYFETYNIIWRYVSAVDAFRLAKAIVCSSLVIVSLTYLFQIGFVPRSIYFIDGFLLLIFLTSVRLSRRLYHEYRNSKMLKKFGAKTLIYGAGASGQGILKRLVSDRELKLCVIGFLDDDQNKIGKSISGYRVFGGLDSVEAIVRDYEIKQIVVGIPNPSADFLKNLLSKCAPFGIKPLLLISDPTQNYKSELREIELKDLLRRPPHAIDIASTRDMIRGKCVLVTGAGGSIGSEIVRQVLSFSPSRLINLDHSEFNLYTIDQELKESDVYSEKIVPALVDVRDMNCLKHIFETYRPEIVFHAAAYKHVHLVEANPFSAIINNIEGTKNVLQCCEKYNVKTFVLVSSDKAVNPAGIMGATKRICEILTSIAALNTKSIYCSVRFGNVLGSSGSLIPMLKKQIESKQALTITHKDMTRYFMLIDEAVSLVLKAASISKPGDINVLKMGEPVKIVDIAESLIELMGQAAEDVQIKFTGLRPGEKMFEELYIAGNELNTEHPDILVMPKGDALPSQFSVSEFNECISEIIQFAKESDKKSIVKLSSLINSQYFTSLRILTPAQGDQ
ncbi:MAG: polysaccharide biosynthesis protein [Bdellovibrionaceae bacterium]|nr:polysaccharide biosynthesis protein [Bdellovibrio sp.]